MWIFCKSGFLSAVADKKNPDIILLRARFRDDLQRFLRDNGQEKMIPYVSETPYYDYAFRVFMRKDDFVAALKNETENINYSNFKNAVHDGTVRDRAYMRVWREMQIEGDYYENELKIKNGKGV